MNFLYIPFPLEPIEWEGEGDEPFPHDTNGTHRTEGDYCPCQSCVVSFVHTHPTCERCETWFCPRCQMWCGWEIGCDNDDGLEELCDYCWCEVEKVA